MNCKDVQRYVHAFIDDELDTQMALQVEGHLDNCPSCTEAVKFERWFKLELQNTIGVVSAPSELSSRVRISLAQADRNDSVRRVLPKLGMASAIAIGVLLALYLPDWLAPEALPATRGRPLIDYVAERHARTLPLEVNGPDAENVSLWFRGKVDFAVVPPRFPNQRVQLVGGRISNVGDRQAAHLIYDHDGRPVTVVVFQGGDMPLGGTHPIQVGSHMVHLGQSRGYNVAVWRQGGVSYAVSSDLDQNDMVQLVASVP
jgi:anti-sigma factor RsiW